MNIKAIIRVTAVTISKRTTPKTKQVTPMAMECCGDGFLEFCNGRRVKVRCVFCVRCFCLKSVEDMKKSISVCLS